MTEITDPISASWLLDKLLHKVEKKRSMMKQFYINQKTNLGFTNAYFM